MLHLPPTSADTLEMARNTALAEGLDYVYIGNVSTKNGQNTYCPGCKQLLIERSIFTIVRNRVRDGRCPNCSKQIIGVWK
jgi:pyruvate formate lyase activating enzyme